MRIWVSDPHGQQVRFVQDLNPVVRRPDPGYELRLEWAGDGNDNRVWMSLGLAFGVARRSIVNLFHWVPAVAADAARR